jgi:glycosyltransferase involved in cell wall biosynthesis
MLRKLKADLFLSPDGYLSLSTRTPSIAVFHDLNFEHYPADLPFAERWYYRTFFRRYAAKASRIATVSEYSKSDINIQYGTDPGLIDVVYNGANEMYAPISEELKVSTLNKYTAGRPYFFFVGSLHPRKNLINLFRAFDIFKQNDIQNCALLLAGAKKWWTGEIASVYDSMKYKDSIIFTGRLETDEMKNVMGAAIALTYVSYFEGFGIPIVEAFRCGTPVISSNVTSMPEVSGKGALLINPFNPEEISDAMHMIIHNKDLRNKLIDEGFKRAEIFTWDKSAERLWNCIEKVLKPSAAPLSGK